MRIIRYTLFCAIFTSLFISSSYGQGIKVTFTPSSRQFQGYGNVVVGKTKTQTIIISRTDANPGSFACIITPPKTGSFTVPGNLNFNLGVGESDTITVIFQPTTLGNFRDTILFAHNADTSGGALKNPVVYSLSGSGVPEDTNPKITVSLGGGGFGSFFNMGTTPVGKITTASFTIKNTSDTIRKLTASVGNPFTSNFSVISGGGAFSLDTGKIDTVTVSFTPDTIRNFIDSLIITSNASAPNNRIKVTIFAQGTKADTFPQITLGGLFGARLSFGNDTLPKTKTLSFTIRNSSQLQKTLIGNIGNPVNTNVFAVTTGGGAFSLDSGVTKTITVSFTADSAGQFLDTLIITTNSDGANQSIKIGMSGTGYIVTGPHMVVSPGSMNFGSKPVGSATVSMTAKIINNSTDLTDPLTGIVSSPKSPFSITSGGGNFSALAQHDTISIIVQMATTVVGTFKDTVAITSNSNDNAKTFNIILTGTITAVGGVSDGSSANNFITAMPNPFNGKTTISFSLAESSPVTMKIYDMLGKSVYSSPENIYPAGIQQLEWNAAGFANGEYLCLLHIGKETRTIRILLSK